MLNFVRESTGVGGRGGVGGLGVDDDPLLVSPKVFTLYRRQSCVNYDVISHQNDVNDRSKENLI